MMTGEKKISENVDNKNQLRRPFFQAVPVQAKLKVNNTANPLEVEADKVAKEVMDPNLNGTGKIALPVIQRKCEACEMEELDRKESSDEILEVSREVESHINNLDGKGRSMNNSEKNFFEPRFGMDFSNVKIHENDISAEKINARAYTKGNHVVFNQGEHPSNKKLMAHELAHVVQQGSKQFSSIPNMVQPSRLPCTSRKIIDVYAVNLPGSSRDPIQDSNFANSVLCQCGIDINLIGGESWQTDLLDREAPLGVLNDSNTTATNELTEMTAHRPGGDVIHIYYVPANSFGDRGGSYGYGSITPSLPLSVSVTNIGAQDTLAHELGHALAADSSHHPNANNLLASGSIRNVGVGELEQSQCNKMP